MNINRPIAQNCPRCGTLNHPRISKTETRSHIVTESKYSCSQCGNYYLRLPIETVEKQPISQQ